MKKSILILIIAAVCSISYGQNVTLDFLQDTFQFDLSNSMMDVIDSHSIDNLKAIDEIMEEVYYKTSFTDNENNIYPVEVGFLFWGFKFEQVIITFTTDNASVSFETINNGIPSLSSQVKSDLYIKNNESIILTIKPI